MSLSPFVKHFDTLTRQQILAICPGMWGDEDLLEVLKYFEDEKKDDDRTMAVAELILHSPQMASVDYEKLYLDLIGYYRQKGDFQVALRWAHALITFYEQHEDWLNRENHVRNLAETYLEAGDLDTGLAIFTRLAQASPGDIWNYNTLSFDLPLAGLPGLASEILDQALVLIEKNDQEHLKKQLSNHRSKVGEMLESMPDHSDEISPGILSDFRAALLQPALQNKRKNTRHRQAAPYLSPITSLFTVGPTGNAAFEAEILRQGKILTPELIRLAFDEELPFHDAPTQAVRILRLLRDSKAVELGELSTWLDRANGDWRNELLTRNFVKIGGYYTPELESIVSDTQATTLSRTRASEALAERVKRSPSLREPYIAFIRRMLTRPEADTAGEETIVGFLISDALNFDMREVYPEIKRAFLEDRVDMKIISPLSVQHRWGLLPASEPEYRTDGMYLRLRCTTCNRIRDHFVQNILLDLITLEKQKNEKLSPYDPYIMDHEIICPKCGAVDHYAMTPDAYLALLVLPNKIADLTALISGKKSASDLPPNPRIHPFRSSVFGQPMHPLAGLEEYRRRIAANPLEAKLYMRMGMLLRALYRNSDALAAHRQAYTMNPNDAEVVLMRGFSEHDFGDPSVAKKIYDQVMAMELKGKVTLGITQFDTFAHIAAEGLDLLKRHQPSLWAVSAYDLAPGKETIANLNTQTTSLTSRKRHRRKGR